MFDFPTYGKGNIMKFLTNSLGVLILSLSTFHVHAVTIQECVDDNNGEKSFQKNCPPGTTSINTIKLKTGKPTKSVGLGPSNISITLYTIPDCDSCDVTRRVLKNYGSNFTEVNLKDNAELQNKLKEEIGAEGSLQVPTVIFGEKQIVGFNKATLIDELEAAGFRDKDKEEADADQKTVEKTGEEE